MKIAIAVGLIVAGLLFAIGGSIWYTKSTVSHECQALEFILHSKIQNQKFVDAVQYWANADGCN